MQHVIPVTEATFETEVVASELPVLVDYWAPWCAPCRAMAPILESLAAEHAESLKIVKVDVDRDSRLAEGARIEGLPTLVLYEGGKEALRLMGARPKHVLEAALPLGSREAAA